jgi:putative ABC transport system permease protein
MRIATAAYRLLLRAFPPDVRREFGDDMAAMFAMQVGEARRQQRSVVALWIRGAADAVANGLGERLGGMRPPKWKWRSWMRAFLQDTKYALRMLARQPGVTVIAVLTLALGIGANTAIFSAVNAVLLRPLPYDGADRIVTVWEKRQAEGVLDNVVAPADFLDWAKMNTTFEAMAAMLTTTADLTGDGDPERLFVGVASPAFFDVLRVRPALGRTFTADERLQGKPRVAMITHTLWTSRFGSDRAIVGRRLVLNGNPVEIVGVLPASFEFPDETLQVWGPLALEGGSQPPSRALHSFTVYGRLKAGVSIEQARADMERIGTLLQQQYPDTNAGHSAWVIPFEERLKGPVRSSLLLLLGAVAFVLLIACVNVANILLARAAGRGREMGIRSAVGAGRARLAGQMLTESVVLGVLGGGAGLIVAWWAIGGLKQLVPAGLPVLGIAHMRLEPRVLAFTAGLSLATSALFGLLPAWHLASQDANVALKDGGRGPGGVRRRLRVALVVSEVALASLLLVAAGLTLRSFLAVLQQPAGFRTAGAISVTLTLPPARYRSQEAYYTTFATLREQFAAAPGALGAAATSHLPLSGRDGRRGVTIEGREPTPDTPTRAHPRIVTPGYMDAMGITVLEGRGFTEGDRAGSAPVAIVNQTMARRYWPGVSPVGRRVRFNGDGNVWMEVVGVNRRRQALGTGRARQSRDLSAARPAAGVLHDDDLRCPHHRRICRARAGAARARARGRSESSGLDDAHDGRGRLGVGGVAPRRHAAHRGVRCPGAGARRRRHPRRHVSPGGAALGGDRRPHDARRQAVDGDGAHPPRRHAPGARRTGHRSHRRRAPHAHVPVGPVRRAAGGRAHACRGGRRAPADRARRVRDSRPPGDEGGPGNRAPQLVTRALLAPRTSALCPGP